MKAIVGKLIFKPPFEKHNGETMQVGDLIYSEYWDTYAVFLGKGKWDGWIRVYLPDTQERKQVHDFIWELA